MPTDLGFSRRRDLIGGRAMSEEDQGATPHLSAAKGGRHPRVWLVPGPHPDLLRTSAYVGKIGGSGLFRPISRIFPV
jgi:hypothetical protein